MTAQNNPDGLDTNSEFTLSPQLVAAEAHDLGHLLRQARRELSATAKEEPKFAKLSRFLTIAQEHCDGLMDGVKILGAHKLDADKSSTFDLQQLLSEETELLAPHAAASMLSFKVESSKVLVNGNRTLIARALRNLLINAIAASAPNSEIKISTSQNIKKQTEIAITNRGRSPDRALLENLSTLSKSTVITSGFGLYVASRVALLHGGNLTGVHDTGVTTFKFSIEGIS